MTPAGGSLPPAPKFSVGTPQKMNPGTPNPRTRARYCPNLAITNTRCLETKTENVRSCRHGDILAAIYGKRHRRSFHENVRGKLPERLTAPLIHRREAPVGLAIENQ